MTATPLKCGLIGYGLSGRVFHAPFIHFSSEFQLTAVNTRSGDSVQERYPESRIEAHSQALIAATDIDLIVITAPNTLHYSLAKAALLAGKHVVLEKPAVTHLAEIEDLAHLAKQQERLLSVYQNRRFDGDFLHLQALIASGSLGTLKHLDSRFDRFRPTPQNRWREQPGEGTGIFWDLGPHLLDQALALLGPPSSLLANLKTLRVGGQTTDWFELLLDYPGCQVTLGSTPFEAGPMRRFNARFSEGSWQCWGLDPQEEALRADQMPWHQDYPKAGTPQTAERYQQDSQAQADPPLTGHYQNYYQALFNAITNKAPPPVSLDHACALIYGLELAEQSSQLGQRLPWAYKVEA